MCVILYNDRMVRKYTQTLFLAWFPFIRSSFLDAPADHRGVLNQVTSNTVINMRMVQGAENIHHAGRESRFFIDESEVMYMPRGEHPNSRKALETHRKGTQFNGETAVKAQRKSLETKAAFKSLNADLREQCTPEMLEKINKKLLALAASGNLKAYELVRDGLGEKPKETVQATVDPVVVINDAPE